LYLPRASGASMFTAATNSTGLAHLLAQTARYGIMFAIIYSSK
jgi:hypothetical protein